MQDRNKQKPPKENLLNDTKRRHVAEEITEAGTKSN